MYSGRLERNRRRSSEVLGHRSARHDVGDEASAHGRSSSIRATATEATSGVAAKGRLDLAELDSVPA